MTANNALSYELWADYAFTWTTPLLASQCVFCCSFVLNKWKRQNACKKYDENSLTRAIESLFLDQEESLRATQRRNGGQQLVSQESNRNEWDTKWGQRHLCISFRNFTIHIQSPNAQTSACAKLSPLALTHPSSLTTKCINAKELNRWHGLLSQISPIGHCRNVFPREYGVIYGWYFRAIFPYFFTNVHYFPRIDTNPR